MVQGVGIKEWMRLLTNGPLAEQVLRALKYEDLLHTGRKETRRRKKTDESAVKKLAEERSKCTPVDAMSLQRLREGDNPVERKSKLQCKKCGYTVEGEDVRYDGEQLRKVEKIGGNLSIELYETRKGKMNLRDDGS